MIERFLQALWSTVGVTVFAVPVAAVWMAAQGWRYFRKRRVLEQELWYEREARHEAERYARQLERELNSDGGN